MNRQIPFYTLPEVVNEYMLASGSDRRKYYLPFLNHAKWIWKQMMWRTLMVVKHKYIKVDTSTSPYSISIPKDSVRFINVSVEDDCNNMRSLSYNDNMNVFTDAKCDACPACGEKDLISECVNNISLVEKDVVIDGEGYKEKIWKKLCENGDLVEIRIVPVKDYSEEEPGEYEITYQTITTRICSLEKKKCGCVVDSKSNRDLVITHCGTLLNSCQKKLCSPTFVKQNAKFGQMRIQNGRVYLRGNIPPYVMLSYQTNGECSESDMMVPEIAVPALMLGMKYRADAFAPTSVVSRFDKQSSKYAFQAELDELDAFLNPIIMTEFINLQMTLPKWGSNADQRDMRGDHGAKPEDIALSQGISADTFLKEIDDRVLNIINNQGDTTVNVTGGELWEGDW